MATNTVIILRSVPGAGKSTIATKLSEENPGSVICSADNFPGYYTSGRYVWSRDTCANAHTFCHNMFADAIKNGVELIIVDNTNLTRKGWQFYHDLAVQYKYRVKFIEITPSLDNAALYAARNCHYVNEKRIREMIKAWEPIPAKFLSEQVTVEEYRK